MVKKIKWKLKYQTKVRNSISYATQYPTTLYKKEKGK